MIYALSIVAVIYTSLVALAQTDMKKLIAYSSVAHMGVVTIGIFTFNAQGLSGALFQMLSHGVVSAALFLIVGVVYDRIHSRDIARYGGLADRMPSYALVFMVFMMLFMLMMRPFVVRLFMFMNFMRMNMITMMDNHF